MKRLWFGDYYPEKIYLGNNPVSKIMLKDVRVWPDFESEQHGFTVCKKTPRYEIFQPICRLPMDIPATDIYQYLLEIVDLDIPICTFTHDISGEALNLSFVILYTANPDIYEIREVTTQRSCGFLAAPTVTDAELQAWSTSHYNIGTYRANDPWYIWVDYEYEFCRFEMRNIPFEDPYNHIYHCTKDTMSLYIDGDVYSRPYTYECNPQVINQIKTDVVTFKSDPDKWLIGAKLRQSTYTCPHGSYGNSTIVARFGGGWDPMTGEYSVVDAYRGISGMVNRATRFPLYGPYPDDVASIYVYGTVDNSYVPPTDQKIHVHITLDGEDLVDQVVSTGDKWPASGTNYYFTTDVGEIRLSKTSGDFVVMQSDKDEDLYLKDYKVTGTVLNDDKIVWNKNGNASLKSTWYDERRPVEIELNYVKDPTKWQIMRVHTTTLNGEENTLETLFAASRNKGGYKYLSDCIYNVTLGDRTSDKYIQAYVETRQGGHVLSHSYPEDRNIIYEEDPVDNNYVEKYRFKLAYVDFNLNEPIDIYITADWRNELFQMVNFHFTVDGVEQEVIKRTMVKWYGDYGSSGWKTSDHEGEYKHTENSNIFSWAVEIVVDDFETGKYHNWSETRVESVGEVDIEKDIFGIVYTTKDDFAWDRRTPIDIYITLVPPDIYKVKIQHWGMDPYYWHDNDHHIIKLGEVTANFDRNYQIDVPHAYFPITWTIPYEQGWTWVNDDQEKIYHIIPNWIESKYMRWKVLFDDIEIPLDETFTSFDIPMDLITKRTGHVIKIYSATQNNWESVVYHEDDHVRMILTLRPNNIWSVLENSGQSSIEDVVYDAFFHESIAARIKYEWSTDPDDPSLKALKATMNWAHRDPMPDPPPGTYTYDVMAGCLNYNYIVQRNGKLTFRDPAPCNVLFKVARQE